MNKDAITKTAVCRWDGKERCFVVQSPLYEDLIGAAETADEAWDIFEDFLDDAYTSYLEGRLGGMYAKRGRPPKNRAAVHCEVSPATRHELRRLASDFGCSQGETIDYLIAVFNSARDAIARPSVDALMSTVRRFGVAHHDAHALRPALRVAESKANSYSAKRIGKTGARTKKAIRTGKQSKRKA